MSNTIKRQHKTHFAIHQQQHVDYLTSDEMDELQNLERIEQLCRNLRQQREQLQQPLSATG